jgi:hypothetical protein
VRLDREAYQPLHSMLRRFWTRTQRHLDSTTKSSRARSIILDPSTQAYAAINSNGPKETNMTSITSITNMSLGNTSHAGGPRLGELVPSRYTLRVGELDVMVIGDGVLPLPAATLATNAESAAFKAWLDDSLLSPDVYTWPLNVVVVRSGSQTAVHSTERPLPC